MQKITKAAILARGLGSRMKKADPHATLSAEQDAAASQGAKGMINVGRPFLDYVISALADAGITDVCLVIGPEHSIFRDYYDAAQCERVRIHYAVQEEPLGTANAVQALAEFAGDDHFLVVNSDNYYPVAGLRLLTAEARNAALGFEREALLARSNIPAERVAAFGLLLPDLETSAEADGSHPLREIREKPEPEYIAAHPEAVITMNAWAFSPDIFAACAKISPSVRGEYEITDAVRQLVQDGSPLQVIPVQLGVLDMSNRGDIASVKEALAGVEVRL